MKAKIIFFIGLFCLSIAYDSYAQGPPITSDKPIMLGANRKLVKTLSEIRQTPQGTFVRVPLMIHYLPSSNTLLGIHVPLVHYQFKEGVNEAFTSPHTGLGDINLLGKYQFFRKDEVGKTLRMVAKVVETIPTGADIALNDLGNGHFQTYLAWVIGYETLKYGISHEVGYKMVHGLDTDEFKYKLGFGLPLLKPVYPVKQINLYFEYNANWMPQQNNVEVLYAQGIQYAIKQLTIEAAIQVPLYQKVPEVMERKYGLLLGTRYVF